MIKEEQDLGIIIDNELKFTTHLAEQINKANKMFGLIRSFFLTLAEVMFVALVRAHLEYGNQVWCPYKNKDVKIIEAVQRRATKLVPTLKNLSYEERLRKLDLPTLVYRRSRRDMVETYKIMNGVYYGNVCEGLFVHQTVFT